MSAPDPRSLFERLLDALRALRADRRDARALREWRLRPVPPPPHAFKHQVLLEHARRHGLGTLVETGTFEGEMVRKCLGYFRDIVTIELDPGYAARAARRFAHRPEVRVVCGDSAQVLPAVLATLEGPALFWLDGHFSGPGTARGERDTPLVAELTAIVRRGVTGDVVLVDDARLLGEGDYPTLADLTRILAALHPRGVVRVEHDIVRCLPVARA